MYLCTFKNSNHEMKHLIFLGVLLVFLAGCQSGQRNRLEPALAQAEQLIDSSPDSAYNILSTMPVPADSFSYAAWTTLVAEALNKKDIALKDSVIFLKKAVRYFDEHNKGSRYQAKAHYYLGICYLEGEAYSLATREMINALPYANKVGDLPFILKIKSNMANTFICANMMEEADSLYHSMIPIARKLGDNDGLSICYFQIGKIISYGKQPTSFGIAVQFHQAMHYASLTNNKSMKASILYGFATYYLNKGNLPLAIKYINKCKLFNKYIEDYLINTTIADTYALQNKNDSAIYYFKKNTSETASLETRAYAYKRLAEIYEKKGDLTKPIFYYKLFDRYNESCHNSKQTAETSKVIRDNLSKWNQDTSNHSQGFIVRIGVGITGLIVLFTLLFSLLRNKRKRNQVDLHKTDSEHERVCTDVPDLHTSAPKSKLNPVVEASLELSQRTHLLNNYEKEILLFQQSSLYHKLIHNGIYNSTTEENKNRLDENVYEEVTKAVDTICPDYIAKLKEHYPQLSNSDLKLCKFYALDFSAEQICSIMGYTAQAINKRKRAIKQRMNLDPSCDIEDFLKPKGIIKFLL